MCLQRGEAPPARWRTSDTRCRRVPHRTLSALGCEYSGRATHRPGQRIFTVTAILALVQIWDCLQRVEVQRHDRAMTHETKFRPGKTRPAVGGKQQWMGSPSKTEYCRIFLRELISNSNLYICVFASSILEVLAVWRAAGISCCTCLCVDAGTATQTWYCVQNIVSVSVAKLPQVCFKLPSTVPTAQPSSEVVLHVSHFSLAT